MKKLLLGFLLGTQTLFAQKLHYYPSSYARVVSGTDTLLNGFAGGLAHPMFFNLDLNFDGLQDLVLFDRGDGQTLTYIALPGSGNRYKYAPQFEDALPPMRGFAAIVDYNKDGKPDVFTMSDPAVSTTGLTVYKNISAGKKLKFALFKNPLQANYRTGPDLMPMLSVEIPAFVDMDGDGDMDIITYAWESSSSVRYYKNMSQEKYGKNDSLEFSLWDECLGKFYEYDSVQHQNAIQLGFNCSEPNVVPHKRSAHTGSTIMAWDDDGDGDVDLIIGDASYPNWVYLRNGRKEGARKIDTMISKRYSYPKDSPVNINFMPEGFRVDIDHDGLTDMVASPMDIGTSLAQDFIWCFHNDGIEGHPYFTYRTKNFLSETMLDVGAYSTPAFFDYNGDGLPDVLVRQDPTGQDKQVSSRLLLYVNIGTRKRPAFKLQDNDYLNFSTKGYMQLTPCFADMNGDGKPDLLFGQANGQLLYYENVSTVSTAVFSLKSSALSCMKNGSSQTIDVGDNSAPAAADLDGDGKPDLLVGTSTGKLHYYHNISSGGNLQFEYVTDTFGGIGAVSGRRNTMPCITDLDRNGHPDLLLGALTGYVKVYKDVDSMHRHFSPEDSVFYNYGIHSFEDPLIGIATAPAAALLDNDSFPDVVIGNYRGGLLLYTSMDHGDTVETTGIEPLNYNPVSAVNLYPNPASNQVSLQYTNQDASFSAEARITDLLGRQVLGRRFQVLPGENKLNMDLPDMKPGVYIFQLLDASKRTLYTGKLLINSR